MIFALVQRGSRGHERRRSKRLLGNGADWRQWVSHNVLIISFHTPLHWGRAATHMGRSWKINRTVYAGVSFQGKISHWIPMWRENRKWRYITVFYDMYGIASKIHVFEKIKKNRNKFPRWEQCPPYEYATIQLLQLSFLTQLNSVKNEKYSIPFTKRWICAHIWWFDGLCIFTVRFLAIYLF